MAAAFDLAAANLLPAGYPHLPTSTGVTFIPVSVLKAVGWVESHWQQDRLDGAPLVSFDFGYGIMQITSGMAGAFGSVTGSLPQTTQVKVASDFMYNIGFGAMMLVQKWAATPKIGKGNPAVVEDWYYALWAYNGWGWVNNPNNPRFSRRGTPATNPSNFPYQERVLYLVAHPPKDADGNPLWPAVRVTLPSPRVIGSRPGAIPDPARIHWQATPTLSVAYEPPAISAASPGDELTESVGLVNTGSTTWQATGGSAVAGNYHLFRIPSNPWKPFSSSARNLVLSGKSPVPLAGAVAPGQTAYLTFHIPVPAQRGKYRLAWDPLRGKTWLSRMGVKPFVQSLRVGVHSVTATPTLVPAPAVEDLRYVADTSIPDGTVLSAGESFRKGWLVFNAGAQAWTASAALEHTSGATFGAKALHVPALASCQAGNIVAAMSAPPKPGAYTGTWRLKTGKVTAGDPLTVVITIRGAGPTPSPGPSPTPRPTPTITPTPTPVG